ncbi:MAG: TetR/AcrR family transcriptional regulator [Acidimicrobiales bacterium]|jgi:AcrR family transcriptional regulator
MSNLSEPADWREGRRRSARDAIVRAAWTLVDEEGLAGLSLRDLARRAGITTPTVYAYFESKSAIYDAMFGQAATEFADRMAKPIDGDEPHEILAAYARRFVEFCTSDPARYQLLFQRTLPGFEPSPESYAPAICALANAHELLALHGITEARHIDLWTALITGLVDQQISNDPGGDRWTGLVEESVTMLLAHSQSHRMARKPSSRPTRTKGPRS